MRRNTFIKFIAFIFVFLTLNQTALAAPPDIHSAIYYTDCWYYNPFGPDGCHEVVCANVTGADSVVVVLEDPWMWTSLNSEPGGSWYCGFVEDYDFTDESLKIVATITRIDTETSERYTNALDNIIWMDAADGIKMSDFSTSPLVSWNEDPDAQGYYLRVYDSSNNEIHRSPQLESPEYQIPSNVLNNLEQYYFRLLNQNYDYDGEWHLENRSSTWIGFMPLPNLDGTGKGQSADRRLNAFVNMLNNAVILFRDGDNDGACDQLEAAHSKCDGELRPPDLVEGDDAETAMEMIETLMIDFGC